ncbi:MAG: hypothetical protein HY363_00730 [Candidatus Aenigmarchaeota archaeon]|nr:hypothetical protein [Candidatus Aenigmarchaeota archaeon]
MVETEGNLLKLNFDTDDPFYEPGDEEKESTHRRGRRISIDVRIDARSGENYTNKALDIDVLLDVGDCIHFRTRDQTGH